MRRAFACSGSEADAGDVDRDANSCDHLTCGQCDVSSCRAAIISARSRVPGSKQLGFDRYAFMYWPVSMLKRISTISPFDAMR